MTEISRWGRSDLQRLLASLIGRAPEMPPGSRQRPAATSASTRQPQGNPSADPSGCALINEQVHHSAEISLLRDLYRNRGSLGTSRHPYSP